jgi:hypothetical protein
MKYLLLAALPVLSLFLCGCGDSAESLAGDMVDVIDDMNDILASVVDRKTAEQAAPKLEALGLKMQEITKKLEEIEKPDLDDMIETTKEIEKEMQEAMSRWMRELQRISQIPDAMELLEDAMEKSGFSK